MNISNFNVDKSDSPYMIIVMIFTIFTVLRMIEYHMSGGIFNHDKSVYLINALVFAGMDVHNIHIAEDLFFSPLISLLTAILFKFGLVNKLAIFIVTGFFGLFGNIGLYILLKNRFNKILSLTGAIIFGSLSIILLNISSGLLDFPSIVVSIWIIIFTILAVNKNSKYFMVIFPLIVLGFFTRYTVGLILPVIIVYYLLNRNFIYLLDDLISDRELFKKKCKNYFKSDEFKYICISICIGVILLILFCKLILDYGGSLVFIDQSIDTFKANYNPNSLDASDDKFYYIKNFVVVLFREGRRFDFTLTCLLCSIIGFGILLKIINYFNDKNFSIPIKNNNSKFKTKNLSKILYIIIILSFIGSIIAFFIFSNHIFSNILFLIMITAVFFRICENNANKFKLSFDLLILSWFLVYFIFSSLYSIKVPRYAMPFIPPFICFVIYGLDEILRFINANFHIKSSNSKNYDGEDKTKYSKWSNCIPSVLIIIFLVSTFTFIMPLAIGDFGNDLVEVTDYIKDKDSNYYSKMIISEWHNYRTVKWYLNKNVTVIDDGNEDSIDSMNADYVILQGKKSFDNYHKVFHSGRFYLYVHN